uniref:Tryptophan 2,3-dioxygenase n=1 Tax=Candidatus Kentrum sp. FW TaxID=2126338 RepID=A0A450SKP1_9GAMM|nr:MAG: tryptophan 2,3-dioxygenase [Candidatus Kentron sp. FW]
MNQSYHSYLVLDQLLDIQRPLSGSEENDEVLFIVFHQISELWFKLLLRECEKAGGHLSSGAVYDAIATFTRMSVVMKTLVD